MPNEDAAPFTLTWGESAMATLSRIITSNPSLSLSALKQHAAVAGLVSETTVEIYAGTGPWVTTGVGDLVRLTHDMLGFGTEWASDSANSGRTLPTCKGAFFVDGSTPRWLVLCKSFYTSKGNTILDIPLAAGVYMATNVERGILIADCFGSEDSLRGANLACGAKGATLALAGTLPARKNGMRMLISMPLDHRSPVSVHALPGCDRANNFEDLFEGLLRESKADSDPSLGFAGLLGFNHPNLGLAPAIEESDDVRSRAFESVRRRLAQRSDDPDVVATILKLAVPQEPPHSRSTVPQAQSSSSPNTKPSPNPRPKRTPLNLPGRRTAKPAELLVAERAMDQFAHDRDEYLKYIYQALRRDTLPLGIIPLRQALQSLRNAVYLSPKEAEAIWTAILGSRQRE